MNQLDLLQDSETSEIANRYLLEILDILQSSNSGYDLSKIKTEHRVPDSSDPYDTILLFDRPCFHIKGKKTKYLYLSNSFAKLLNSSGIAFEHATSSHWARIPIKSFAGFYSLSNIVEEAYEVFLRDSDSFGCCGSYLECSNVGHCIHSDIMFSGRCAYRQNLKSGKIFYGKNRNI